MEPEITESVDLCLSDGRLNPDAVGWTRHPLHRANLTGWGRAKRWEYWCVQAPDWALAVTVSHIDYLALHQVFFVDFTTGEEIDTSTIAPFARGPVLPDRSGAGPARARTKHLSIDLIPNTAGLRLVAHTDRVDADVQITRPPGHESMAVVIPWSEKRFQYTEKDNTLPAAGRVVVDGQPRDLPAGQTWAVLDHGRGKWPYDNTWNWGSGSGTVDGHVIGLQFGGKWTEGTGMTENALCIDGTVFKISQELEWRYDTTDWLAPWTVRGDDVDVTLTPGYERSTRTNAGVIFTEVHQCFGTWNGTVRAGGEEYAV
ncbi:MAG TPA: DUF2804 domain-containing protein, partial [Actinomycetota bacterium]|nr:DUF2804 domain-containing protein [Actinomycetota bacterium]